MHKPRIRHSERKLLIPHIKLYAAILLLALPALAQTSGLPTFPKRSGYWMKPISEQLGVCDGGSVAWAQRSGDQYSKELELVDNVGRVVNRWTFPLSIRDFYRTSNCTTSWVLSRDRRHIFIVNSLTDREPIPLANGNGIDEVRRLIPADDGSFAWVYFETRKPDIAIAIRSPQGIVLQEISGIPPDLESQDYSAIAQGKRLLAIPVRGVGIYFIEASGAHNISKKDLSNVYSTNTGELAWLIPRLDKGVYLVDGTGRPLNQGAPLLKDEDVVQVYSRFRERDSYAWVRTQSDRLYAFAPIETPQGWAIRPLNHGHPVAIGAQTLAVDLARVIGSGRVAWVTSQSRFAPPGAWGDIYRVEVQGDDIAVSSVPRQYFEGKSVNTLFWDLENPWRFWARSPDLCLYEVRLHPQGKSEPGTEAEPAKVFDHHSSCVLVEQIIPSGIPSRYWINATPSYYLMGPANDITEAIVSLGHARLSLKTPRGHRLRFAMREGSSIHASLNWPTRDDHLMDMNPETSRERPRIHITFLDPRDHQSTPRAEGEGFADKGEASILLHTNGSSHWNETYDIQLEYHDPQTLTNFRILWPGVTLAPTLYELVTASPYWKALWLLALPIFALLLAINKSWRVRRWIPVAVSAIEVLIASRLPEPIKTTPLELLSVAACCSLTMLLAGLASPALFRELALIQPFRLLVPAALQLPRLRRRVWKSYVKNVRMLLQIFREDASNETYVPLATSVVGSRPPQGSSVGSQADVKSIVTVLSAKDPQHRATILIEAPGGRGKSALWNELLARCLDAFENDPLCPLPVIGDPRCSTVESMVESGLGRFGISPDITAAQLKSGEFVVFIDNLSSCDLAPADLETFFRAGGDKTRLCLTNRPDKEWRGPVRRADTWIIVEPERLSDSSIWGFVDNYAITDAIRMNRDAESYTKLVREKVEKFLPICRSEDGSYLPLLVRLCTLAIERDISSIDDIYLSALRRLLTRKDAMSNLDVERVLVEAEQIGIETYWHEHDRLFRFERTTPERTQIMRELLQAGVVVGADRTKRLNEEPKQVRFFHDSVQSYLVARGLHRAGDWECFLQAAGDPFFCRAASDFIGGTGSELFQMCLYVFEASRVRRHLIEDLLSWAGCYWATLSIDDVLVGLTEESQAAVERRISTLVGAGEYLRIAVEVVAAEDMQEDGTVRLGRLYAKLAPKVWQRTCVEENRNEVA